MTGWQLSQDSETGELVVYISSPSTDRVVMIECSTATEALSFWDGDEFVRRCDSNARDAADGIREWLK